MWGQVGAIWWAQFRTSRNHLPRRTVPSVLASLLSVIWYGSAVALGIFLAIILPDISLSRIADTLGIGLAGVFIFWQVGPLFTMSAGWSLQLNKLQIYPIPVGTLYFIEAFLRFTTAPEMIPVLLGVAVGLLRHPGLHAPWGLGVLLFIPFNLFLSLTVREVVLHSFERNRFRELFTILLISIGLLPQILLRTGLGARLQPYFSSIGNSPLAPWGEAAHIALGKATIWEWALLLAWTVLFFYASRVLFARSLTAEDVLRTRIPAGSAGARSRSTRWLSLLFSDPLAALVEKEVNSLLRMPRFRVSFGMACVFSVVVFIPLTYRVDGGTHPFLTDNFLEVVVLYGLLILSDALMLNVFGTDRGAVQLYFAAPIPLRSVFRAKNIVATLVVLAEAALVMFVVLLVGRAPSLDRVAFAVFAAIVVGLFFTSVGNMSSTYAARPIDPAQTFRKQAGARMQLWLLGCSVGMAILIGAAHLAWWAVGSSWAGLTVLAVELAVAAVVYRIALDSAVERAERERETLVGALTKNASPVGTGS